MNEVSDMEEFVEDVKGLSVVNVCEGSNGIHLEMSDGSILVIVGAIGHYRVPKEIH